MTQKDLVRELKSTIKELSDEKDDLLVKLRAKEGRIKQILIQLEQSTEDVAHVGKKIKEQEDGTFQITICAIGFKTPNHAEEFMKDITNYEVKIDNPTIH